MALTDFFRINLPYGLERTAKGEWLVFNREYMPVGWHEKSDSVFDEKQHALVSTPYKGMTDSLLIELSTDGSINRDDDGTIRRIWLYNDRTNPTNDPKQWENYLGKIKKLSKLKVSNKGLL